MEDRPKTTAPGMLRGTDLCLRYGACSNPVLLRYLFSYARWEQSDVPLLRMRPALLPAVPPCSQQAAAESGPRLRLLPACSGAAWPAGGARHGHSRGPSASSHPGPGRPGREGSGNPQQEAWGGAAPCTAIADGARPAPWCSSVSARRLLPAGCLPSRNTPPTVLSPQAAGS